MPKHAVWLGVIVESGDKPDLTELRKLAVEKIISRMLDGDTDSIETETDRWDYEDEEEEDAKI